MNSCNTVKKYGNICIKKHYRIYLQFSLFFIMTSSCLQTQLASIVLLYTFYMLLFSHDTAGWSAVVDGLVGCGGAGPAVHHQCRLHLPSCTTLQQVGLVPVD
jgi:hypothetical protein